MTSPASSWLPDHQLVVAATLSHADELIGQVSDLLFAHRAVPALITTWTAHLPADAGSDTRTC